MVLSFWKLTFSKANAFKIKDFKINAFNLLKSLALKSERFQFGADV